jgi:pantoate--beta-alanine ligase
VLTVVAKLLNIVRPDFAFFGEKDYQQLVLIRRMVTDLDMDTRVIGVPIVREPDGLALSSRNVYLNADQRQAATALSGALSAGAYAGSDGPGAGAGRGAHRARRRAGVDVDYLELRDPELGPAPEHGEARLLVAAKVGTTRLIDNVPVLLGSPHGT